MIKIDSDSEVVEIQPTKVNRKTIIITPPEIPKENLIAFTCRSSVHKWFVKAKLK